MSEKIEFVTTDTEALMKRSIASFESKTGRTVYEGSPEKLFISWLVSEKININADINRTANANIPSRAEESELDSVAEFVQVERLPAEAATVVLRFTASEAVQTAQLIPKGTRVSTADGKYVFETGEDKYIEAVGTYADVTAECTTAGVCGNGISAGSISKIIDNIAYITSVTNSAATSGGSDEESDEEMRERIKTAPERYSTAGCEGAYIYHAKTVSSSIKDVSVSESSNTVSVKLLCSGGESPSEALISKVSTVLNDKKIKPLGCTVSVAAPETVNYTIALTYYIDSENASVATEIGTAITSAVSEYVKWQSEKMGRDVNPSKLMQLVMAAGAKRAMITAPTVATVAAGKVAKLSGTAAITNGGSE